MDGWVGSLVGLHGGDDVGVVGSICGRYPVDEILLKQVAEPEQSRAIDG